MDKVIQTDEEKKGINFENLFNASSKWIVNFKKKHSFSRRKFHKKRRTKTKLSNIIKFLRIVCKIFNNSPKNKILNVDETCWCFEESGDTHGLKHALRTFLSIQMLMKKAISLVSLQ